MTVRFILPGKTPSQNEWDHLHWAQRYELRNTWFQLVQYVCRRRNPPIDKPAYLTITRVAKRLIDYPNIAGPTKPLIDALVEYGHLKNDNHTWLLGFAQEQRKPEKGEEECMIVDLVYKGDSLPSQDE